MTEAARINVPEWSVSELSAALKRTVEDAYGYVRVRGEISNYRGPASSGHCYFALKDEGARIDAVIWRGTFGRIKFKPEEGLEVIATGRLTTYPGRSSYQIVIDSLEPAGVGALMALLEERKKKLAAEGLFDEARKQLLPYLPDVIGVITSPTGAVIRDILHRLADRFPRHVLVWPVRVQGDGSAEEVAAAIVGFNALPHRAIPRPVVVRAAADSMIPLISAVGHETDVTLIDFVADRRAPTPTAAAEMAVPVKSELIARVDGCARRALACWLRGQEHRRTELRAAMRALPTADTLLSIPRQRVDACADRLPRALRANAQVHHTAFSRISGRLTPQLLRGQVERRRARYAAAAGLLAASLRHNAEAQRTRIARNFERVAVLAGRAERAIAAPPASSAPASFWRRCPITACSRAALRWCAGRRASRCAPPPRSRPASGSISNSRTVTCARAPRPAPPSNASRWRCAGRSRGDGPPAAKGRAACSERRAGFRPFPGGARIAT